MCIFNILQGTQRQRAFVFLLIANKTMIWNIEDKNTVLQSNAALESE